MSDVTPSDHTIPRSAIQHSGLGQAISRPGAEDALSCPTSSQANTKHPLDPAGQPVPANYTGNPLLDAAEPILIQLTWLRNLAGCDDTARLYDHFTDALRQFERNVTGVGCPNEDMLAARYALCACIDETVLTTPWGEQSTWSTNSLLNLFHQEVWGGEKMFQITERIKDRPERYGDVLELITTCFDLGFEGHYRVVENGRRQLDVLRDELHAGLRGRNTSDKARLSSLDGVAGGPTGLVRYVPIWAVWGAATILLIIIYSIFEFSIEAITRDVIDHLSAIGRAP